MSHMVAASQFCALIALKRGENAELATIAGLLHDIYAYRMLTQVGMQKKALFWQEKS
jgi:HD superfamily phosphodiesterase